MKKNQNTVPGASARRALTGSNAVPAQAKPQPHAAHAQVGSDETQFSLNWGASRSFLLAACSLFVVLSPHRASALSKYDKTHTWDLRLKGAEGYGVAWQGLASALAGDPRVLDRNLVNQPPVPAPAANTTGQRNANSGGASADAIAFYTANANGTGSHTMRGKADLGTGNVAISQASSIVSLRKTAPDAKGNLMWKGDWAIDTISSTARETDPVHFSVRDLDTDLLLTSDLFSFIVNLSDEGGASWKDGTVTVDGLAGNVLIEMDSPFITTGVGRLYAEFANGLISVSEDSGVFDGLLPGLGAASSFSFGLGGSEGINIGFDFGDENLLGYSFNVDFGVEARVAEMPEQTTTAGMLGLGLTALHAARRWRTSNLRKN